MHQYERESDEMSAYSMQSDDEQNYTSSGTGSDEDEVDSEESYSSNSDY